MQYHVIFSLPDVGIWEGPGKDATSTFNTFSEAKQAAIKDLEHWLSVIQENLQELRSAQKLTDLHYHA